MGNTKYEAANAKKRTDHADSKKAVRIGLLLHSSQTNCPLYVNQVMV